MDPISNNIGATLLCKHAFASTETVAAGSGDNTKITGTTIDRKAIGMPQSAILAVHFDTTLTEAKTLKVVTEIEDSADGSTWAAFKDVAGTAVGATTNPAATGATGGSSASGVVELNVNLSGARRYVRANCTPDLNATATDVADVTGLWVFGGIANMPV